LNIDYSFIIDKKCMPLDAQASPDSTYEKAIQLAYRMTMVLLSYPFLPEIMYRGTP
jgi:hypothetical protein